MMAPRLRTLVVLVKGPGSVPSAYMVAHNCNSGFWGSDILF